MIYCDSTLPKSKVIFCSCWYVWNYPCFLVCTSVLSRPSFVSRPVLCLDFRQVVGAAINTVHIQLEHSITWSLCLSLLEFFWLRNKARFIAAYAFCVMCNFSYFTLRSYYRYTYFCLVLTLNPVDVFWSVSI